MTEDTLWLETPPQLSDQAACEMLDFMYQFINAFENHYADQLRRATPSPPCLMQDLFAGFDDDIP